MLFKPLHKFQLKKGLTRQKALLYNKMPAVSEFVAMHIRKETTMRQSRARSVFISFLVLLIFSFFGGLCCTAWAENIEKMLIQVNKELRQAQKNMFTGKTDKAVAALDKIQELLAKIRSADPNNRNIKTAENKYSKLVKDLERRTGEDLGGGTLTSDQAKSGDMKAKATATACSEEVNADVKTLKAEYDRVSSVLDRATGKVIYYNDLKPAEELIVQIEDFERNELDKLKQNLEAFARKYGTTKDEIDKKAGSMGYTGRGRASFAYTELRKGIGNLEKTRVVMAEDLLKKCNRMLTPGRTIHDFYVAEHYGEVKAWIKMASRYDSENPKVKEALGTIDQRIAKGMKAFHAKIDKRTWPEHAANAPKNAEELATAAVTWFKNSPDWGKNSKEPRKPLGVVVTGPWSIQEKNILGEPIMYGLPILLAFQVDSDKELNVARVYSLTMRTVEKRGVKMEPPFDHVTVGNSYFIRSDKVK
jgi:hypothetical protein